MLHRSQGCGRKNFYGVYARVASFEKWVTETVRIMTGVEEAEEEEGPSIAELSPGNFFQE